MTETFKIPYTCGMYEDSYLDALYGVMSIANKNPRKNRIYSYSYIRKRALIRAVLFLLAAVLIPVLVALITVIFERPLGKLYSFYMFFCLWFSLFHILIWFASKHTYKMIRARAERGSPESGTLTLDVQGYRDECESGEITKRLWTDYHSCIITSRVILLRSKAGIQIHLPATEENIQTMEAALCSFGKQDTILHCTLL